MMHTWSSWKRFPDVEGGDTLEAPIGPGVYEVRHTITGREIAFGSARNVARALSALKADGGIGRRLVRLFRRRPLTPRILDLEYRTCAAASRAEAKVAAHYLLNSRQIARRQRVDVGLAARH